MLKTFINMLFFLYYNAFLYLYVNNLKCFHCNYPYTAQAFPHYVENSVENFEKRCGKQSCYEQKVKNQCPLISFIISSISTLKIVSFLSFFSTTSIEEITVV